MIRHRIHEPGEIAVVINPVHLGPFGGAYHKQADGVRSFACQNTGGGIGLVMMLLNDLQHPLPGFLRHIGIIIDHTGDGASGNTRQPGDILTAHVLESPFRERAFTRLL
ncbi:hypothetical protein D3C81_2079380 [compost metagenome]